MLFFGLHPFISKGSLLKVAVTLFDFQSKNLDKWQAEVDMNTHFLSYLITRPVIKIKISSHGQYSIKTMTKLSSTALRQLLGNDIRQ